MTLHNLTFDHETIFQTLMFFMLNSPNLRLDSPEKKGYPVFGIPWRSIWFSLCHNFKGPTPTPTPTHQPKKTGCPAPASSALPHGQVVPQVVFCAYFAMAQVQRWHESRLVDGGVSRCVASRLSQVGDMEQTTMDLCYDMIGIWLGM
jgi:hypothetical protein